ncbi:MAG: GDCCVxC domain-containing (seleno)protein [Denitratisoma sp.]|nr:GDCCVxC domain-containing (seleno)protein [Denitratisoma sp.]
MTLLKALLSVSSVILESILTCPECGFLKTEIMPTDACLWFHQCHAVLKPKPKPGDGCIFCSYGTVPCPLVQECMVPPRRPV